MRVHARLLLATACIALCSAAPKAEPARVTAVRVPNGGIQPQVVERDGTLHLLYFGGAPEKGDLFYTTSRDYGKTFSAPLQVNTSEHAMAVGNIRGAQLAVGRNGRVHVAWNGVSPDNRMPMFYARLNNAGTAFEKERNLISSAWGIDGGGSLAADAQGNVYVFWHAPMPGTKGEENRRVWVAKSTDDGATFAPEHLAYDSPIGACGCCGMKAWADTDGSLYVLFRSAEKIVNRDIWLLRSKDGAKTFTGTNVSHWNIGACVMSSEALAPGASGILAAWETEKQAYFATIDRTTGKVSAPIAAPGEPGNRKHPVVAANQQGDMVFAWTDGMAWKKPGTVSWQIYSKDGKPLSAVTTTDGVPVWSVIAAFAKPDGTFGIIY